MLIEEGAEPKKPTFSNARKKKPTKDEEMDGFFAKQE
jgi:hypothetical protein